MEREGKGKIGKGKRDGKREVKERRIEREGKNKGWKSS